MRGLRSLAALAAAGVVMVSMAADGAPPAAGGYLAGHEPATVAVIPPAPTPGDARDMADRAIFKETRKLEGSPRWALAQNDVILTLPAVLGDFSCAAGVKLNEDSASSLVVILRRLYPDLDAAYNTPKNLYRRPRPYMRDEGHICVPRSKGLDESYDYPSGHAVFAWTYGLILAELLPDRAGPILARARAFGESRAVCGVHSANAVGEARTVASTLVAALNGAPAFRSDLDVARRQLAALPPTPPDAACAAEAELTARTPW